MSESCVCDAGWYADTMSCSCQRCPAGTFKRRTGNIMVTGCIACPADWFRIPGSYTPTGLCRIPGYSCSRGVLTVSPGYSVPNFVVSSASLQTPTRCQLIQACPGSEGKCEIGYDGPGCRRCADGYVSFGYHCAKCAPTAVGTVALILWAGFVTCCSAVVTTLQIEESGVSLSRTTWINLHGQHITSLLHLLFECLCLFALQFALPSQIPRTQMTVLMSVIGSAVSPGIWSPTMCVIPASVNGFDVVAVAATVANLTDIPWSVNATGSCDLEENVAH
jgi:hypothetical protein